MNNSYQSTECINGRQISSFIDTVDDQSPNVLFLHGGAEHASPYFQYLVEFFNSIGYSCLRFDHYSWGESKGDRHQTNLQQRIEEALFFCKKIKAKNNKIILVAASMGGHIALEILRTLKPSHLILFCPAAYATKSVNKNFGDEFSSILKQPNSFKETHIFDLLKEYEGNLLHLIGQNDVIIPMDVTSFYKHNAINCHHSEFCVIKNATHNLQNWFSIQQDQKDWLFEKLKDMLDK